MGVADLEKSTLDRNKGKKPDTRAPARGLFLTVLHHPDYARVGDIASLDDELASADVVRVSRSTPAFASLAGGEAQGLGTRYLSRARPSLEIARYTQGEVELRPGAGTDECTVSGALLTKVTPVAPAELDSGLVLTLGDQIVLCLHRMTRVRAPGPIDTDIIGESDGIVEVRRRIRQVAELEVPVLIRGETGTGKELVARAIARASGRPEPFVALNMATLAPSLAAATLFGHERGAFTGAVISRGGCFLEAAGGTLLLDEIGATPPDVQPMLLRALESGEIFPLGARRARRVDVRVIAATDADLEKAMAAGAFLPQLFQRLASFQIRLPPLRKRREDFGRLLVHFLRKSLGITRELHRLDLPPDGESTWLSGPQVAQLATGTWPGNVRALANAIRHIAISSRGLPAAQIDDEVEDLIEGYDERGEEDTIPPPPARPAPEPRRASTRDVSRERLLEALSAVGWSSRQAAATLGLPRTTMSDLMDRYEIPRSSSYSDADIQEAVRKSDGDLDAAADMLRISTRSLSSRLAQPRAGRLGSRRPK